ncbi:hypothetical protein J1TS3_24270 [Siminovitchia fordii]|uniref:Integrase n=2 Tax=Siminovitchia fordii TaxID=254759 RepID=A0ABQ4K6D5_9BACI|nr:hypothetical protein J1TS3_24270 [Siminovitchia fordii]
MINLNIKIKELIQSTLITVGMDLEVRQECSGINMSYNFILHYVGFDLKRIKSAIKEIPDFISIEDYIRTFSLHEIGHAVDREALLGSLDRTIEIHEMKQSYSIEERYKNPHLLSMLIEEHQMNIAFEETAWENAERLNKKYGLVNWRCFHFLRTWGLKTYIESYERDFTIFEGLVNGRSEQIA